jgi:hypothetical protein
MKRAKTQRGMIRILGLASLIACATLILAASFAPSAFALSANAPQLCVGSPLAPPDCTAMGTCPTAPTNGTCGTDNGSSFPSGTLSSTDPNLCAAGGGTVSGFTGTGPWTWQCVGANGGSTATCSASLPQVPAMCGPASAAGPTATAPSGAANLCSAGTAPNPATATQSGSSWVWICYGANGGANVSCSEPVQPTLNGICGTDNGKSYPAPPDPAALTGTDPNLCASGTLASFTYTGTGWTWNCNGGGLPPGTNASCAASVGINGVCGTVPGTCTAGTVSNVSDNGTTTTWTCNGTGTGTSASCSSPDQLNGACGSANGVSSATAPTTGLCTAGTASAVTSSGGNWVWTCNGFGGGTNASCSAPQTCVSTGCAASSTITCGTAYVDNCGNACGIGTQCASGTCDTGTGTCGSVSCTTGCTGSVCTIANGGTITLTGHISYQKSFNSTGATWPSPLPAMGIGSVFTGNAWGAHLGYFGMSEPFTCSAACGSGDVYCHAIGGTDPYCDESFYTTALGTSLWTETEIFTLTNDGSNPGKNFLLGEQCNYLGQVMPGYYMTTDPTYGGCADTWDVTTCTAANTIPPPTYYWHQASYATPSTCPSTCQQTYTYECWCIGVGCAVNAPAASPGTDCTSNGVPMPGPTSCYGGSCPTCWKVTTTPCLFSSGACNEDTASSTVSYATFCSSTPMCTSTSGFSCDSPSEVACVADGYPSTDPNCGGTPVNGVCATPPNGGTYSSSSSIPTPLCSSGTPSTISGSGPWTWTCYGSGTGATNDTCTATKSGAGPTCGTANGGSYSTAPTTNLCSDGSTPAVTSSGGNWVWTCGTNSCKAQDTSGSGGCISTGCADPSTIACGQAYADNCGNPCGYGTSSTSCAASTPTCVTDQGTPFCDDACDARCQPSSPGFLWSGSCVSGSGVCTDMGGHGKGSCAGGLPYCCCTNDGACSPSPCPDPGAFACGVPIMNDCGEICGTGTLGCNSSGTNASCGASPGTCASGGTAGSVSSSFVQTMSSYGMIDSWTCTASGGSTAACSFTYTATCPSWTTCTNYPSPSTVCGQSCATTPVCTGTDGNTYPMTDCYPYVSPPPTLSQYCNGGTCTFSPPSCGTAAGVPSTSAPASNLCASGTAGTVTSTGSGSNIVWFWTCSSGTVISCTAPYQSPLGPSCGTANGGSYSTAPTTNLCSDGSTPTVTASGGNWTWTCGTNSCSATDTCVSTGCTGASTQPCGVQYATDNCGNPCYGTSATACSTANINNTVCNTLDPSSAPYCDDACDYGCDKNWGLGGTCYTISCGPTGVGAPHSYGGGCPLPGDLSRAAVNCCCE